MRVLTLTSADADLKVHTIDLSTTTRLEAMQVIVGGFVDFVGVHDDLDVLINDEMAVNGSRPSLVVLLPWGGEENQMLIVCGACAFVGHDGQGEHVDLTDAQIERVRACFRRRQGWMNRETGEDIPVFVVEV